MNKKITKFTICLVLGLFFSHSVFAQYSVGPVAGQLSPVLKNPIAFCPSTAQVNTVCDCPAGYVAVGYEGLEGNVYGTMVLSQFKLRCKQLNADGTLGAGVTLTCANGTSALGTTDGPMDAAAGQALVGAEVRIGCAMDAVIGRSKLLSEVQAGLPNAVSNAVTGIGGLAGSAQPVMYAPNGNVIVGMQTYVETGTEPAGAAGITVGVAWRYAPILGGAVAAVPTMSEWGLILFALIIFSMSLVFGVRHQRAMAMQGTDGSTIPAQNSRVPFDRALYFKVLPFVYMSIAAVFAAVMAFGYELTTADIPGSVLSGAVIAYLVHFVMMSSKKD